MALLACAGCGSETAPAASEATPHEATPTAPRASDDPAIDPELGSAPEPASWPREVEDLASTIERFESIESCLASLRESTPTSVSEGLGDVGYDRFFEDVCGGLAAARARDAARCDELSISSARAGCRRRVALVAGDPSMCPEDPVLEGRDPLCVAWAARDPGLCRAVSSADRAACASVLSGDASRCPRASRARCEAWVRRYSRALGDERAQSAGTADDPQMQLSIARVYPASVQGGSERIDPPVDVEVPQLARGVRLRAHRCAHRLVLDERGEPSPFSTTRPGARIEVDVPARAELPLELPLGPVAGSIAIAHPSAGRASGGEGRLVLTELERALGGAVAGTFDAELPMAPGVMRVSGRFRTFVRDLEPLPSECSDDRMTPP